jgi:hypothetical protein
MPTKFWSLLVFSQFRWFWKTRNFFEAIWFNLARGFFQLRYEANEEYSKFQSLRNIFFTSARSFLFAAIASYALHSFDKFMRTKWCFLNQINPEQDAYISFLSTVAGIGGVFIGLYYTALSSVGSSIYSKVPNNLRNLLARERIGNVYMNFLSFLTFLCLCLIGYNLFGSPANGTGTIVTIVLSGFGIIAFVKLGQRTFFFFDPTTLSISLFHDLWKALNDACAGGFQWQNASFQNHTRIRAKDSISAIDVLSNLARNEKHLTGESFLELSKNILHFLIFYANRKSSIPTQSRWFVQKPVHRKFYMADESAVSMAAQTATIINPEMVSDRDWVESQLEPIFLSCLQENVSKENWSIVTKLLSYIDVYLQALGESNQCGKALKLTDQIMKMVSEKIIEISKLGNNRNDIQSLQVIELVTYFSINIFLSYAKNLNGSNKQKIKNSLLGMNWKNPKSIYLIGLGSSSTSLLEWLRPRIIFEINTEGKIISPQWYILELVARKEGETLAENCKALILSIQEYFRGWQSKFEQPETQWYKAALCSRELEYWFKVNYQIDLFTSSWSELSTGRRIDGLTWPNFADLKLQENVEKRRDELLQDIALQNVLLSLSKVGKDYPDYSGQFLHMTAEAIIDAICNRNAAQFQKLFSPFFVCSFMKFTELKPTIGIEEWRGKQGLKVAAAPIMDLLEISGLAFLMSELSRNEDFRAHVTKQWNAYLEKSGTIVEQLKWISAVVWLTESEFEIPYRSVLRTGWRHRVQFDLRDIPRKTVYRHHMSIHADEIIDHPSPLVRLLARERLGSFYSGSDIFVTLYLRKRPESADIDFNRKRADLEDAIEREEKNHEDLKSDGEDESAT